MASLKVQIDVMTQDSQLAVEPMAREARLLRILTSPYFAKSDIQIMREDFSRARLDDEGDFCAVSTEFEVALECKRNQDCLSYVEITDLVQYLGDLRLRAMGVGGKARILAQDISRVRDALIVDLYEMCNGDKKWVRVIEEAVSFHEDRVRKFSLPILAQILRWDNLITDAEVFPTILSADPLSLQLFLHIFEEPEKGKIKLELLRLIRESITSESDDPFVFEKVAVIDAT
jgi:DNA-binding transcriptional ArsR family regulator